MEKRSINLLIQKDKDPLILRRLRIILPVAASFTLLIFLILFIISINYVNENNAQYNRLKVQTDQLEKKIADQKPTEGLYTLTVRKLDVLDKILRENRNLVKPISEIIYMGSNLLDINQITIESDNRLAFSVSASSSAALDGMISALLVKEANKYFSDIQATNILRDKEGKYNFKISLRADANLFR
ncbi:hypothetical protein FJY90_05600 [Candidatus Gottesmanbacteria bacterium]|nr:hypothetical protein [Candidatus Gottesmanbacteria bacterium]